MYSQHDRAFETRKNLKVVSPSLQWRNLIFLSKNLTRHKCLNYWLFFGTLDGLEILFFRYIPKNWASAAPTLSIIVLIGLFTNYLHLVLFSLFVHVIIWIPKSYNNIEQRFVGFSPSQSTTHIDGVPYFSYLAKSPFYSYTTNTANVVVLSLKKGF